MKSLDMHRGQAVAVAVTISRISSAYKVLRLWSRS